MMRWRGVWSVALVATVAGGAAPAEAQYLGGGTKTAAEVQVADLESLRDKFVGLTGAFSPEQLDWRPMEGVRSTREVIALVASEATMFSTMWGFDPPPWVAEGGFVPELQRLNAVSQRDLVTELERSFAHLLGLVRGLDPVARGRTVNFFGLETDQATAVTLMANDMHEHLGQLIAYARTNGVVPPWSRRGG